MNKNEQKKSIGNFGKFGGLIFVAIFVIAVFIWNIGMFGRKYELPVNRSQYPVVYTKNNALGVMLGTGKKPTMLSDYLVADEAMGASQKTFMSKNGETIYFLEGYDELTQAGSFFASFDGKTKVPISSKAYQRVLVSEDGGYVVFAETPDLNTQTGALYLYKKKGDKQKIADNILLNHYTLSKDAKKIGYIESNGDFYVQTLHGDKEKIDSGVSEITALLPDGIYVYIKPNADGQNSLYYWSQRSGSSRIAEQITQKPEISSSSHSLIFLDGDKLCMKEGKKQVKILDTNVSAILQADVKYGNLLYTKNFSEQDFSYDIYLKRRGKAPEKIVSSTDKTAAVTASYDFSQIAYLSGVDEQTKQGTLYLREYGVFKKGEPKQIAKNVSALRMPKAGYSLAYLSDGVLHLYQKNKDFVISEGVNEHNYRFTANGNGLYYISNYTDEKGTGNLYRVKTSKSTPAPEKVESDIAKTFYPRTDNQVIYLKNYDINTGSGTLVKQNGKKQKEIDSGIINVLFEE